MSLDRIQHVDAKAGGSNCKTSNKRIIAARRRIEAMQLRQEGLTYRQIGERLGCSTQRAQAIVQEQFARLRAEQNDLAENILKLTNDRIERLMQVHWAKALAGDKFANEMLLRLIDRQARLFGADAPRKTEQKVEISDKDPDALRAQARMMGLDITDLEKNDRGTSESIADERVVSPGSQDRAGCDGSRRDPSDGRERTDSDDSDR